MKRGKANDLSANAHTNTNACTSTHTYTHKHISAGRPEKQMRLEKSKKVFPVYTFSVNRRKKGFKRFSLNSRLFYSASSSPNIVQMPFVCLRVCVCAYELGKVAYLYGNIVYRTERISRIYAHGITRICIYALIVWLWGICTTTVVGICFFFSALF